MLKQFYETNNVPESDRIRLEKNVIIVSPSPDFDTTPFIESLGLSRFEVATTWPKRTVELLPEICAVKPKFVLQVGKCRFPKKFPFARSPEQAERFRDKAISSSADGFVGLHHHDEFSIKDALGTVKQLVELLKAQRRSFCCVTNHGSVGGWIRQYNACREAGIKAVFGMEAYISNYRGTDPEIKRKCRSAGHLVLIAATKEGFDNIIKIHNDAWLNGFYYSPRTTWRACRRWGKGIVATTACMGGEIPRLLMAGNWEKAERVYRCYAKAFDKVYVEIQIIEYERQKEVNRMLIEFARKVGAPLILACDSHYLDSGHANAHDILMCIRQYKKLEDLESYSDDDDEEEDEEALADQTDGESADVWAFSVRNLFYRNADQMRRVFEGGFRCRDRKTRVDTPYGPFKDDVFTEEVFREALANTRRVAMMAEEIKLDSSIQLPKLYPNAEEMLRSKVNTGFTERGLGRRKDAQVYIDRVNHEHAIICKLGWADYFLVMDRIVSDAKRNFGEWCVGYGRGCFHPSTRVVMSDGVPRFIGSVKRGDVVVSDDGSHQSVLDVFSYDVDEDLIEVETDDGRIVRCTKNHEWLVREPDGRLEWKEACRLEENDEVIDVTEDS